MALFFSSLPLFTGLESQCDCITEKAFQKRNMFPYQKAPTNRASIRFMHAGKTAPCVLFMHKIKGAAFRTDPL